MVYMTFTITTIKRKKCMNACCSVQRVLFILLSVHNSIDTTATNKMTVTGTVFRFCGILLSVSAVVCAHSAKSG